MTELPSSARPTILGAPCPCARPVSELSLESPWGRRRWWKVRVGPPRVLVDPHTGGSRRGDTSAGWARRRRHLNHGSVSPVARLWPDTPGGIAKKKPMETASKQ